MTGRGLPLNNPMDLMHSPAFSWKGEIWPSSDPQGRLCQFGVISDGIRAGALDLLAYGVKDGCGTIRKIISRYAPPPKLAPGDHNPTEAYIAFVADWVGAGADELIDLQQPAVLFALVGAIIHFENGADVCSAAQIQQGVTEALESFKVA